MKDENDQNRVNVFISLLCFVFSSTERRKSATEQANMDQKPDLESVI